jgi:hypothetical protein
MIYGAVVGIAFAVSSWGWDGYVLNTSHAYYPSVMFLVGLLFYAILGGICGRLTARFDSGLLGVVFWIIAMVEEHIQESRYLFVAGYDEYLGDLQILVKFGDQWVDCNVLYSQPNVCKPITGE